MSSDFFRIGSSTMETWQEVMGSDYDSYPRKKRTMESLGSTDSPGGPSSGK